MELVRKWTNASTLYVGNSGIGTLNITNGGAISVAGTTYLGLAPVPAGAINFGADGGTLTTYRWRHLPANWQAPARSTPAVWSAMSILSTRFRCQFEADAHLQGPARPKDYGES